MAPAEGWALSSVLPAHRSAVAAAQRPGQGPAGTHSAQGPRRARGCRPAPHAPRIPGRSVYR